MQAPRKKSFRTFACHRTDALRAKTGNFLLTWRALWIEQGNEHTRLDKTTKFTAYFKLNQEDDNVRQYLDIEFPEHYTCIKDE